MRQQGDGPRLACQPAVDATAFARSWTTPIEALLTHYNIPVADRDVVILGRGAALGRPLAMLLSQKRPIANVAVTVVHTDVPNWPRYARRRHRSDQFDVAGKARGGRRR